MVTSVLARKEARGAGYLALGQYLSMGLGLLATIVAARGLGAVGYGTFAVITALPALVWSVVGVKSNSVTVTLLADARERGDPRALSAVCQLGYGIDVGTGILATAATAALVTVAHDLVNHQDAAVLMIVAAAGIVPLATIATTTAILTTFEGWRALAATQIAERAVVLGGTVIAVALDAGVAGVVCAFAAGGAVAGPMGAMLAKRKMDAEGAEPWWSSPPREARALLVEARGAFGWHYASVTLAGAAAQAPPLLLGAFAETREAGFYRLASALAGAVAGLEGVLSRVFYPRLAALGARGDRVALRRTVRRLTARASAPLALLTAIAGLALPLVIEPVFGAGYGAMDRGAQLLMWGAAGSLLFFTAAPALYSERRMRTWTVIQAVTMVLVIAGSAVGATAQGFTAVAAVCALGSAGVNLAGVVAVLRDRAA